MAAAIALNIETTGPNETTGPSDTTKSSLPIVLSHGVGSDTRVWDGLVPKLSETYRVIAWDQPGHGTSPELPPDAYGPELPYDSLVSVVSSFERMILVGHSMGGYVSARYAIEYPSNVAALVLIATGPGFRSPEAREKWNTDIRRLADKQGKPSRLLGLHADSYVMDHLPEILPPTLLIVGSEDKPFLSATDYIEKKVPGIERFTIEGAGHLVPSTHAAEVGALIEDFLRRHVG